MPPKRKELAQIQPEARRWSQDPGKEMASPSGSVSPEFDQPATQQEIRDLGERLDALTTLVQALVFQNGHSVNPAAKRQNQHGEGCSHVAEPEDCIDVRPGRMPADHHIRGALRAPPTEVSPRCSPSFLAYQRENG